MPLSILEGALGGIGLFLLGVKLMSEGIRSITDDRIRNVFLKITSSRLVSMLFGIVMTLAVSSGGAAVVFAIGLVNGGVLNVFQALCVLAGVLIGSALSLHLHLIPYSLLSGFLILGGFLAKYFFRNRRRAHFGTLLLGVGLLFFGLSLLAGSYQPINNSHPLSNLVDGVDTSMAVAMLFGSAVSFLVQSSHSTISIIDSLVIAGSMEALMPVAMSCGGILGISAIGLLASVGGKTIAIRIATLLMIMTMTACLPVLLFLQPVADLSQYLAAYFGNHDLKSVISWSYTVSSSLAALLLMLVAAPVSRLLLKAELEGQGQPGGIQPASGYLDRRILVTPPIALEQSRKEVQRMASVVSWMYADVLAILSDFDARRVEAVRHHEQQLDALNSEITSYLALLSKSASGPDIAFEVPGLIQVVAALEHIGDVCEDILDCTLDRKESGIVFSDEAMQDLVSLAEQISGIISQTLKALQSGEIYDKDDLHRMKTHTRQLYDRIRESHFERICKGVCPPRSAMLFQEMSASCMRIAELCWSILGIQFRR